MVSTIRIILTLPIWVAFLLLAFAFGLIGFVVPWDGIKTACVFMLITACKVSGFTPDLDIG